MLDVEGADEADEGVDSAAVSVLDRSDGASSQSGAFGKFGLVEVSAEAMLFEPQSDALFELGLGESEEVVMSHNLRKIFFLKVI